MHLVNNIDFKARRDRPIICPVNNFAHIIHPCIAGRIHFQHVNMPAAGNIAAMLAHPARAKGRPACAIAAFAIQPLCQNSGRRGFANAAHPCQHKGMGQPAKCQRIAKGAYKSLLSDKRLKTVRAIFTRQNAVGCRWLLAHKSETSIL